MKIFPKCIKYYFKFNEAFKFITDERYFHVATYMFELFRYTGKLDISSDSFWHTVWIKSRRATVG